MKLPVPEFLRKLKKDFLDEFGVIPVTENERREGVNQEELKALPVYQTLRDSVKEGMALDELIDAFAAMCRLPVGDPDDLLFETGTYNFTGKKLFYFSLVRQFQFRNPDEYVQLHLDVRYAPSPATARLCDTEWGSIAQGNFFQMVRSGKAYQKVKDMPMAEVEVYISET